VGDARSAGHISPLEEMPPKHHYQRWLVLESIVMINNYRMELVGYNQINTVFDPEYVRIQNLEGSNKIAQYYFCPGDYNINEDNGRSDSIDDDN
jgi:hypothetical protein